MKISDKIYCIPEEMFSSNVYVLGENEICLIDTGLTGLHAQRILREVGRLGLQRDRIKRVILTHTHPDHKGGLGKIYHDTRPTVYVHKTARLELTNVKKVDDGDKITFEDFTLEVLHTPGHKTDCICLYDARRKILFSGDTVFTHGSVGRTDMPGGDTAALLRSIERLREYDVDILCPGHMRPVRNGNEHINAGYEFVKSMF